MAAWVHMIFVVYSHRSLAARDRPWSVMTYSHNFLLIQFSNLTKVFDFVVECEKFSTFSNFSIFDTTFNCEPTAIEIWVVIIKVNILLSRLISIKVEWINVDKNMFSWVQNLCGLTPTWHSYEYLDYIDTITIWTELIIEIYS